MLGKLFVGGFIPIFNYLPVILGVHQNRVYPLTPTAHVNGSPPWLPWHLANFETRPSCPPCSGPPCSGVPGPPHPRYQCLPVDTPCQGARMGKACIYYEHAGGLLEQVAEGYVLAAMDPPGCGHSAHLPHSATLRTTPARPPPLCSHYTARRCSALCHSTRSRLALQKKKTKSDGG